MRNIKFIINGIEADFYKQSDLAPRFTYRSFNIEDLGAAAGNYALNVNLPKTKNNNKNIFNFINVIENDNTLYYQKKYNAYLEIDGDIIFNGTLTVNKITKEDYQCTFIGDNIDFADIMSNKSLRDIESFDRPLWSGVRSSLYNPFPEQWPNSVGYRDYWLDNTGLISLDEKDGLEFCLPLISYGNFNSAPNINVSFPIPIGPTDTASDNRYVFHGTSANPFNWGIMFPSCYLTSTVKNMFADFNYSVSGDLFLNEKYKNIFMPFTSPDLPGWNWGLMHRVNIDWTQLDGSPGIAPYNRYSFSASQINSQVRTTPSTTFNNIYIKLFANNIGTTAADLPTSITVNERYMFNDSYRLSTDLVYSNNVNSFVSQIDGEFNIRWEIKGFGGLFAPSQWFKSTSSTPGFYFILVNRGKVTENNESVLGAAGNGLIDINNHLILDSQVLHAQFYDTTTGAYDNLEFASQDFVIDANVTLKQFDTLELMFVSINENPLPGGLPQYITMDQNVTSNLTVTPLNQDIGLNPAKFLPDISQADFLRSILNTYNLFLFYDENSNQIVINEYDNYFLPSSTEINWSDKCSLEDDSVVFSPIITNKQTDFKLTGDDNDILIYQDNIATDATVINDSLYYNEIKTVQLGHSFTSIRPHYLVTASPQTNAYLQLILPTMSTEDVNHATLQELYKGDTNYSYDFNWRLLKYKGMLKVSNVPNSIYLHIEDQNFVNSNGLFVYPYSVQEDPISYFNPRFQGDNNLLETTSWLRFLNQLQQSVSIELDVYLKASDINKLDLRKPIRIGFNQFQIDSIDEFNPMEEGLTRVKLLKK